MMGILSRFVGQRNVELAKAWAPTAGVFGAAGSLIGLYLTDWKLVLQFFPYYGGKFREEKTE